MKLDPATISQVRTKLETDFGLLRGYARCPAHGGNDRNLKVTITENNMVLTHCHSHKCTHEQVMAALGITRHSQPKVIDNRQEVASVDSYPYMTADGKEVWAVRNNFDDGTKAFKTFPAGIKGKTLPYRHEAINSHTQIIIVEGEKAVEHLLGLGYTATTNKGGAQNAKSTDWSSLANHKDVILWPDSDMPGENWEQEIVQILHEQNCKISRVPVEFSEGKGLDAADYSEDDIEAFISSVVEVGSPFRMYSNVELLNLDGAKMSWLVDGAIINSGFFLITAKPKSGKSTISRQLAMCVANGVPFLGKDTQRTKTCYFGFEDGITFTNTHINEHMLNPLNNKDPKLTGDNIGFFVDVPPVADFTQRLAWLHNFIKHNSLGFIMLDSLFFFLEGIVDSNSYEEMLRVLKQLKDLAKSTKCTIGCTHHTKKAEGDYTLDNCLGSTSISGTFESIFLLRSGKDSVAIESKQRGGDGINGRLGIDKDRWLFYNDTDFEERKQQPIFDAVKQLFLDMYFHDKGRKHHNLDPNLPPKIMTLIQHDNLNADLVLKRNEIAGLVEGRNAEIYTALDKYLATDNCVVNRIGAGMSGSPYCYVPDGSQQML